MIPKSPQVVQASSYKCNASNRFIRMFSEFPLRLVPRPPFAPQILRNRRGPAQLEERLLLRAHRLAVIQEAPGHFHQRKVTHFGRSFGGPGRQVSEEVSHERLSFRLSALAEGEWAAGQSPERGRLAARLPPARKCRRPASPVRSRSPLPRQNGEQFCPCSEARLSWAPLDDSSSTGRSTRHPERHLEARDGPAGRGAQRHLAERRRGAARVRSFRFSPPRARLKWNHLLAAKSQVLRAATRWA